MASLLAGSCKFLAFSSIMFSLLFLTVVMSVEFEVGGKDGWAIPDSKNDQLYDHWASNNRFNVNDTLRFEYKKDSVLVVSEEEYNKCKSSHPIFFSNNGNTVFKFDRPGLFYFISGVAGHCERGQKMIIKVLEPASQPPPPPPPSSGAAVETVSSPILVLLMMIIMSLFGAIFV
ncbi:hypothetical protein RHSIM_Rhsim12G0145200 [Rhododendron simsii]|uniref:Phytocyanin domain-containing protein n=1 Tax=Rhododendron simsii TaxID=118357 RepID=A0A834G365_RHOSS|nr:hypothetical protein RHSIM_Rhsim12G0145200 [Rhododendron simsii]